MDITHLLKKYGDVLLCFKLEIYVKIYVKQCVKLASAQILHWKSNAVLVIGSDNDMLTVA